MTAQKDKNQINYLTFFLDILILILYRENTTELNNISKNLE